MDYVLSEWLNLVLRWLHVVAAVFWIGQTALFAWLDHRMAVAEKSGTARVYMVHSGGFYRVDKELVEAPLPPTIHWFKWEAALTWISGLGLMVVVYYLGGALFVPDAGIGHSAAVALSLGLLLIGWLVYDAIWSSPLARFEAVASGLCLFLIVTAAWSLTQVFSGRGAYLQIGAMLGTIMTFNVWVRILPPQRRMIAQAASGATFDPALAAGAKLRSKHNTFLALPLLLIMISNHFPVTTYGHQLNWLVLAFILVVGIGLRWLVSWHESRP